MKNLKGKNALLTGGSMGIGPNIARVLAREGVNIALSARSEDKLTAVAHGLKEYNVRAIAVPADVTDPKSREKMVETVKNEFGRIDLLINNAGIEWLSSFNDLTQNQIQNMIETNLIAPLMITRLVLPDMLKNSKGHIVTISSLGGKKGSPYSATYAAAKAGLIAWTSSLRAELYKTGVSASVVCPGFISDTGMFAEYNKKAPKIVGESKPEDVYKAVVKCIKKDIQEIVVNPGATKLMMIIDAVNPNIITSILRKTGVHEFFRRQAQDNKKQQQQKE